MRQRGSGAMACASNCFSRFSFCMLTAFGLSFYWSGQSDLQTTEHFTAEMEKEKAIT
jgi:hypothetical protein